MAKKIVLKVRMNCDKCRKKAMTLMASVQGVDSIAVEGNDRDNFVVIGDGIDSIKLVRGLRKKVGHTDIVSVNEVKDEAKEKKEAKAEEPKIQWYPSYYPNTQLVFCDENYNAPAPSCSIL